MYTLVSSFKTENHRSIGLIVEDISNPFFSHLAQTIEEEAKKIGYKVFYCSTKNDSHRTVEQIKTLLEANVAGFIIAPPERIQKNIRSLLKMAKPVVLIDRYLPDLDCSHVVMDNYEAVYVATTYLIHKGYKNIALVNIDSDAIQMKLREQGYMDALNRIGIYQESLLIRLDYHTNKDQKTFDIFYFLKKNPAIDSVLFLSNYLCLSGLEALKKMELKIPENVAVMSFDDHPGFLLHEPPISVIQQPIEEMAAASVKILTHKIIGNTALKIDKVLQKGNISIRGST